MRSVALMLLVGLGAAGCDAGSRDDEQRNTAPLHVTKVEVFDMNGVTAEIAPNAGATVTAAPNSSIRITFDRFLLPAQSIRQAICVQPIIKPVATIDDCTDPVTFEPTYDPVKLQIDYRLSTPQSATPSGDFMPNSTYQLTMLVGSITDATVPGVHAFDGVPLEEIVDYDFKTGAAPLATDPDPPASQDFCDGGNAPVNVLSKCQSLGCHVESADVGAAMGLQFGTQIALATNPTAQQEVIARTAVDHVAHETMTGEHATVPDDFPLRFGRAMPIVETSNAGNSYVLYKLLVSVDASGAPFVDPAEAERLRESVVVGAPMPLLAVPGTLPGIKSLSIDEIEGLSQWIQAGAPLESCATTP
ncbi:MAG TPA: hypothetical protein VGM56_03185 [Byssovorax sp.]